MSTRESWRDLLAQVVADNVSGARGIAVGAATALIAYSEESKYSGLEVLRADIRFVCAELVRVQPSMASLIALLNAAWQAIDGKSSEELAKKALGEAVLAFQERLEVAGALVSRHAVELLGTDSCVLTISASSTVAEAVLGAHAEGLRPQVICLESRPMMEGRGLASRLVQAGIPVTLMVDAAAFDAVQRADVVWLGVDALAVVGVVGKLGSAGLALAASERGIPAYVLADRTKIWPSRLGFPVMNSHAAEEVWPDAPVEVQVWNRYFDLAEWRFFEGAILEGGVMTPEMVVAACHAEAVHGELVTLYTQLQSDVRAQGETRVS